MGLGSREAFTAPTRAQTDAHALCFHARVHLQEKSLPAPSDRISHPGLALPPPETSDRHLFPDVFSENFAGEGDHPGKVREQKIWSQKPKDR